MIKVEVKYYDKPIKVDKEKHKIIKHIDNYTINEYGVKDKDYYDSPQATIRKEVTKMFKKYKGIFFIKFYVHN